MFKGFRVKEFSGLYDVIRVESPNLPRQELHVRLHVGSVHAALRKVAWRGLANIDAARKEPWL